MGKTEINYMKGIIMNIKGELIEFSFKYNNIICGGHSDGYHTYSCNHIQFGNLLFMFPDSMYDFSDKFKLYLESLKSLLLCSKLSDIVNLIRFMIPKKVLKNDYFDFYNLNDYIDNKEDK